MRHMTAPYRLIPARIPTLELASGDRLSSDPSLLADPRPGPNLLLRAMLGRHKRSGARVLDVTAGFGGDAFQLAASGLHVTAIEREPGLAALLTATLERAVAGAYGDVAAGNASRIELVHGDAREWLSSQPRHWHAAIVDPMYPVTRKTAKANRALEILREILPVTSEEDEALLAAARSAVTHRAVVKRPAKAPFIANLTPTAQQIGASTRYDIYQPLFTGED